MLANVVVSQHCTSHRDNGPVLDVPASKAIRHHSGHVVAHDPRKTIGEKEFELAVANLDVEQVESRPHTGLPKDVLRSEVCSEALHA